MNFSILILFIIFASGTLGIQILTDKDKRYCFKFTWPGLLIDNKDQVNCSALEAMKIPCIDPIKINTESPPELTEIWSNETLRKDYRCTLTKGYSCIKYTYSFDEAITNVTYFCGKMIKNNATAIQEGCFRKKVGGHSVETCACQSTGYGDGMPCNSSKKLIYSFFVLVLVLLLLSII